LPPLDGAEVNVMAVEHRAYSWTRVKIAEDSLVAVDYHIGEAVVQQLVHVLLSGRVQFPKNAEIDYEMDPERLNEDYVLSKRIKRSVPYSTPS